MTETIASFINMIVNLDSLLAVLIINDATASKMPQMDITLTVKKIGNEILLAIILKFTCDAGMKPPRSSIQNIQIKGLFETSLTNVIVCSV